MKKFTVRLTESTSQRLGIKEPTVWLKLEGMSVMLIGDKRSVVWVWTMANIRNYGYNSQCFRLEAGRKSPSGEGHFTFCTKKGANIYDAMVAMRNKALDLGSTPIQQPKIVHQVSIMSTDVQQQDNDTQVSIMSTDVQQQDNNTQKSRKNTNSLSLPTWKKTKSELWRYFGY
ncbi:docking protein 1-like [Homarus americanus]|uniref:docking protein 1-like n=1 Tax=Homarus americanus TaxID=6706 RepID=UPI001C46BAC9|nr:docking protein 1-like [Homarus americanus]